MSPQTQSLAFLQWLDVLGGQRQTDAAGCSVCDRLISFERDAGLQSNQSLRVIGRRIKDHSPLLSLIVLSFRGQ